MEIAVRYGHPILIRASNPFQTRPSAHLKFNRLSASIDSRFRLSKSIFTPRRQMSAQSNLSPDNLTNKPIQEKEGEKKAPPPPPEKPEAGDCCGSGCVRCVWDVYYEELEDYNKRYKSDSKLS